MKRNTLAQLQRMFLPPNFAFFGRLFSDHKKVYAMAVCFALFWTISAFYQETTEEKRPFCFGQKYFKATELNQASLLGFTTFFFFGKEETTFWLASPSENAAFSGIQEGITNADELQRPCLFHEAAEDATRYVTPRRNFAS